MLKSVDAITIKSPTLQFTGYTKVNVLSPLVTSVAKSVQVGILGDPWISKVP